MPRKAKETIPDKFKQRFEILELNGRYVYRERERPNIILLKEAGTPISFPSREWAESFADTYPLGTLPNVQPKMDLPENLSLIVGDW